jgi:hypothetical protein
VLRNTAHLPTEGSFGTRACLGRWQATAAEIALDAPQFTSPTRCDVVNTSSAGFASNSEMINYLTSTRPQFFTASNANSRLLCRIDGTNAQVGSYYYDRRSSAECSPQAAMHEGAPYTVLGFFGRLPGKQYAPQVVFLDGQDVSPHATDMFRMHMVVHFAFASSELSVEESSMFTQVTLPFVTSFRGNLGEDGCA